MTSVPLKKETEEHQNIKETKNAERTMIEYVVRKGDCLWNIAKRFLGDGKRYLEIKKLNGLPSDTIHPGERLRIAADSEAQPLLRITAAFDPRFPVRYVFVTTPFSEAHPACDFGYNSAKGHSSDQPIFAPCDLRITKAGWDDTVGYRFYATYDAGENEDYLFRFIHLSELSVKEDEILREGEMLGRMGNTGSSCNGAHLHVDVWKVPKGHTFVFARDRHRYAVDPLLIFRLKDGQSVSPTTDAAYRIRREP